tara:strand:- start:578 stop:1015 length:438 start_codon:yes stop_codon:yes gene_type:complete
MLTPEEVLLFQAVRDEEARQAALEQATVLGAVGGAGLGTAMGTVPHAVGNLINRGKDSLASMQGMSPKVAYGTRLKPGFRMAGGLTGLILGGGLGAGSAAMMKRESEAGELLGKLQAQRGQLSDMDTKRLGDLLGQIYQNPSQIV